MYGNLIIKKIGSLFNCLRTVYTKYITLPNILQQYIISLYYAGIIYREKEFINMNELVVHIVSRFEMVLQSEPYREKNYRILTDITQRDLWVELDQDKITQVLDNIINNAIKYSPDGGRIIVRLMETHTDLIVSVSDEGLGIPRKDIPHLFDRFYRVDKARSRAMGGSGLGLAIAKEVVQLHGGKIWVNSIENKGSTFFVSLPYVPFEEDGEWDEF